jgi:hypothetical protein
VLIRRTSENLGVDRPSGRCNESPLAVKTDKPDRSIALGLNRFFEDEDDDEDDYDRPGTPGPSSWTDCPTAIFPLNTQVFDTKKPILRVLGVLRLAA